MGWYILNCSKARTVFCDVTELARQIKIDRLRTWFLFSPKFWTASKDKSHLAMLFNGHLACYSPNTRISQKAKIKGEKYLVK